ncbi:MAG: alpha-galactosidase [Armatimonadia bacterium]
MSLQTGTLRLTTTPSGWNLRWPNHPRAAATKMGTDPVFALSPASPQQPPCENGVCPHFSDANATTLESSFTQNNVRFTTTALALPGSSQIIFTVTAHNLSASPVTIDSLSLLHTDALALGRLTADNPPSVYVDSGSQGGTHVAPLGEGQVCAGICAIQNPAARLGFVCAFLSFAHDNTIQVAPSASGLSLRATTTTPVTLAPGKEHRYDSLLLDVRPSALEAMEAYASVVKAVVNPPIPAELPMGWLSWYAYRLTMTEDTILQNAAVVARHFQKYGVNMIHPDHGWQYKDICGHWINNEKFPHGMKWLARKLAQMDLTLGLWVAPSTISEWAPFYEEHPEGLVAGPDGKPLVISEKWYWAPHGKTFNLDPLTPAGEKYLRDFGKQMRSYGAVYLKTDFIGGWHGARRLRHGMRLMREAVGPEMTLRPCSTALNTQLGVCNEIGIARDIGNAKSLWEHLQVETLELASKWFMHNKFWLNNPDVLIVGDPEETLGEARGRVTLLALTGGVVFLGDRMPELEQQPDRLALCSLCIPSSNQPARPLDLFDCGRDRTYPRLWHLPARSKWGTWDVLGLFNWSGQPLTETITRDILNLPPGQYLVWDFWNQKLLGKLGRGLTIEVPAGDAACLRIMPIPDHPSVLSTNMHITQGLAELSNVKWNEDQRKLTGQATRAPEESGTIYLYIPKGFNLRQTKSATMLAPNIAKLDLTFQSPTRRWSATFD